MKIADSDKNALVHLYRGELRRMVAYRTRLDTTTNWAVITTAALITFTLGNKSVPPYVMFLSVLLGFVFLFLEARRYRYYEMARTRVRLLESGLYSNILGGEKNGWMEKLKESLDTPTLPISMGHALRIRLRNVYFGLFIVSGASWVVKLILDGPDWITAARVGPVGGSAVLGIVIFCTLLMAFLTVLPLKFEED